jgi:fatty acid desaturase
VLPVFDWLHSNFSYHTEHHLFPNVSADFYPLVSKLLLEHYPTRYHRIPLAEAWRLLWKGEEHIAETAPTAPLTLVPDHVPITPHAENA